MQKIVVLSGAGISAESGISTFRDANGLWEKHRIEDVASPEGWQKNKSLVLDFYNQRRRQLLTVQPNAAHYALVELEKKYKVTVITQNVDDLHERVGSNHVVHLHGELLKARSTADSSLIYDWKKDITLQDKCNNGSQLRPHIVWFGEMVPMISTAQKIVATADILIIVGTSLLVYPAAGLMNYRPPKCAVYLINPEKNDTRATSTIHFILEKATIGVPMLTEQLMNDNKSE